ncbi:MAG: methylenetetrahydrofolate reductase C-terminal domain-containing protein [Eggerthellaceae bacterium]|nr:methylenetetrahydrofolate reductase C-terminal domain-containing protein [Eggerthellaceae bacterium]
MQNRFRDALEAGEFVVTCEIIPGRGACEDSQEKKLQEARELWATGRVHAISITDNPSGNPALLPDAFAEDLVAEGIVPLVHLSCKDRNRSQFESQLYAMERHGIQNLLCMTGDYTGTCWNGKARPVFDLDPVTLVQMVHSMNRGMGYPNAKGEVVRTKQTHFFPGAVVSPFKWTEAETMTQLYKLKKKVYAGAQFIISQVGFDARKLQEMLWLMKDAGLDVPFIANIYIVNAGHGGAMNRGGIPGCDVTDDFLQVLKDERDSSDDKGKEARLVRAAKMIAIAKGLGCAGVHLGGLNVTADCVNHVLDMAEEFSADWQACLPAMSFPQKGCFYYYQRDEATGLNLPQEAPRTETRTDKAVRGNYRLSRWFHHFVFVPGKGVNGIYRKVELAREKKKGRLRHHGLEHLGKVVLYDCMDCGDCGLYATAYTCPMVHCPKCQRNGPCGGSKDGWCEVYPGERYCIWYKAYHRLKPYGDEGKLDDYVVPPNDWRNFAKSPWGATCLGIDGYARRDFLPGVEPDIEFPEGP